MMREFKKFKRGFKGPLKELSGINMDSTMKAIQWGQLVGSLCMFVARWLSVSTIAFCVFKYGDKVLEWASR